MLSLLPDYADPLRLCGLGKVYEGSIALDDLPRLAPLLASTEGEAAFVLAFSMDQEHRPVIGVQVKAGLVIACQRCLGPMVLAVESSSNLAVVSGPDEAERLPAELDPLLVEDEQLLLRSLIEDELILAIPPAPTHAEDQCAVSLGAISSGSPVSAKSAGDGERNPFAALAALKSDSEKSD